MSGIVRRMADALRTAMRQPPRRVDDMDRLRAQLERDLGRHRYVRLNAQGDLTIGVGRCVGARRRDHREGEGLHEDEIDALLAHDIASRSHDVLAMMRWTGELDEARFAVLVGLAFDPGPGWVANFAEALADLRARRYAEAARHLAAYPWPDAALPRAQRLATQLRTGSWT